MHEPDNGFLIPFPLHSHSTPIYRRFTLFFSLIDLGPLLKWTGGKLVVRLHSTVHRAATPF